MESDNQTLFQFLGVVGHSHLKNLGTQSPFGTFLVIPTDQEAKLTTMRVKTKQRAHGKKKKKHGIKGSNFRVQVRHAAEG